jgi:3-hydroxyacyl-[acyl-carrier-protein] dehydratase
VRFYLVDRITGLEPEKRICAVKLASALDPVLEDVPGIGTTLAHSLICESLIQSCAWLILASTQFTQRGVLAGLRHIELGPPVPVGDRIDLVAEVDSWSDEAIGFNMEASRGNDCVVRIEGGLCYLIAAEKLEDPQQTEAHYQALLSEGDSASADRGQRVARAGVASSQWFAYDALGEVVGGVEATAVKSVVMGEPVFATHFPRFAVMPGVLLMQSMIELARKLLAASAAPDAGWRLGTIHGARFRKYVRPGDELVVRTRVLEVADDEAALSGNIDVGGTVVAALRRMLFSKRDAGPGA